MDTPPPVAHTPAAQPYWDALARGELHLQRCMDCRAWGHYPRRRCSACGSARLAWREVEPVGTVHTFTVTHRPTAPMFAAEMPQVIAIVDLDIGVRVTTTLTVDDPSTVHIGQRVRGVVTPTDAGQVLLRFAPLG